MHQLDSARLSRKFFIRWAIGGPLGLLGASLLAACSNAPVTPTPNPTSAPVAQPTVASATPTTATTNVTAPQPTAASATTKATVGELTFMRPSSGPDEDKAYQAMLSGWTQHHPETKATFVSVPYADYETKLLTEIAGGVVRDVIGIQGYDVAVFATKKAIITLDPYVKASTDLNVDDFFPAHWHDGQFEGKQFTIPPDGSPLFIAYNTELFQKAGVKPPAADWTWADCLKVCQDLTQKTGNRVNQFGGSFSGNIFPWLFANDANIIDVATNKVTIDEKNAVEALQYLGDLVTKYHVNPTPQEQQEMGQNFFLTGKIGMVVANRGGLGTAYRDAKFKIDVVAIPRSPTTGHSGSQITALELAIETPNKHPDDAWLLLDYLVSPESELTRFTRYGGYPSRKSVAADPKFLASVAPSWVGTEVNQKILTIAGAVGTGFVPHHPNWSQISDTLNKHLDDLWNGKQSANAVTQAAAADISKLMG